MLNYKLIVASNVYRLEDLVNAFLATPEGSNYEFLGSPQVFSFDEYVQALKRKFL